MKLKLNLNLNLHLRVHYKFDSNSEIVWNLQIFWVLISETSTVFILQLKKTL